MILGRYRQNPGDIRRREIDYGCFLETGESIISVLPSVLANTPVPLVVGNLIIDTNGKKFAYVVSGGEDGQTYSVNFRITTSGAQRKNDTIEFDIEEDE